MEKEDITTNNQWNVTFKMTGYYSDRHDYYKSIEDFIMDNDGVNGTIRIRGKNQDEVFEKFSYLMKDENDFDLDEMEINPI